MKKDLFWKFLLFYMLLVIPAIYLLDFAAPALSRVAHSIAVALITAAFAFIAHLLAEKWPAPGTPKVPNV